MKYRLSLSMPETPLTQSRLLRTPVNAGIRTGEQITVTKGDEGTGAIPNCASEASIYVPSGKGAAYRISWSAYASNITSPKKMDLTLTLITGIPCL